ncbi:MAG TPA: tetratricopeptide repeat protein [Terriglobia bacterium]|nr:tetratricopeptide repeat protein [Terriglobia bacterium]
MQSLKSRLWAPTQFGILNFSICWCLFTANAAAVTLVGKVRVLSGEYNGPLATLKLEDAGGSLVDQKTTGGSDDRFEFDGLTNSQFRLRVDAPGFQPQTKDVDLTGPRETVFIDIILFPLAKVVQPTADLPALTDESAPKKARHEYEKGGRALQKQKLAEAMLHYEKAVADYPCYARAQTDLARALVLQNKIPEAVTALRKSIACDGGFLEAYVRLAIILNGTNRYSESEKVLDEGLRLAPSSWNLYYQLGVTHSGLGEFDKAEADYLRVRSLNPSAPSELHVRLADLYHRMKAYDKAFAEMQAYLRDDPNGRFAARTRAVMQEMESSKLIRAARTSPAQPQP